MNELTDDELNDMATDFCEEFRSVDNGHLGKTAAYMVRHGWRKVGEKISAKEIGGALTSQVDIECDIYRKVK